MYAYTGDSAEIFSLRPESLEETYIYRFVKSLMALPPNKAIERFYQFFFEAANPPNAAVRSALLAIAASPETENTFNYMLNRCFYTLCNPWRTETANHWAIQELVIGLENLPQRRSQNRELRQLQQRLRGFVETSQYLALKRQMQVLMAEKSACQTAGSAEQDAAEKVAQQERDRRLGGELKRYFYLHETAMTTKDVADSHRKQIRQLQNHSRQQFERRCYAFMASRQCPQSRPVANPSQLPEAEFAAAFTHYHPKRNDSYHQQAQSFLADHRQFKTMGDFQDEFSRYLIKTASECNPRYRNNHFSRSLRQQLAMAADREMSLNQTMIVHACRRALEFLVVRTLQIPNTVILQNLLKDVGHAVTVGLLLKVVMFCGKVRPWFEERFGILFHVYEQTRKTEIPWLVQTLEHLNIALALNHNLIVPA
ncbi:MAG: hypothetical protein AAGF66_13620 [Cyanobacteria bacterium P01_H01_bin.119]